MKRDQHALILFAHGARDPAWAGPVQAVATKLRGSHPDVLISVAFLEFLTPTLEQAVGDITAVYEKHSEDAIFHIDVLPFFIAQGAHLRNELPEMIAQIGKNHPLVQFRLLSPLGEIASVQEAMADAIGQLLPV